jgi:hypothetical protein
MMSIALCLALDLPTRLTVQEEKGVDAPGFSIGAHVGWFESKDADDGEVYYGLQARIYLLKWLGIEGSVDVQKQDFLDEDADLTTVPVQLTGMIFLMPDSPLRPYVLAGAGWYFHEVEYDGALSNLDDEDDSSFGVHVGGGLELLLGKILMLYADLRYTFLDEPGVDNSQLDEEEFDFWQVAAGAALAF